MKFLTVDASGDQVETIEKYSRAFIVRGSSAVTGETDAIVQIPRNSKIDSIEILTKETGSIGIDFKKCSYSNYPSSFTSICASDKMSITSTNKGQKTSFTGWTLDLVEGDYLRLYIDTNTGVYNATITIRLV